MAEITAFMPGSFILWYEYSVAMNFAHFEQIIVFLKNRSLDGSMAKFFNFKIAWLRLLFVVVLSALMEAGEAGVGMISIKERSCSVGVWTTMLDTLLQLLHLIQGV